MRGITGGLLMTKVSRKVVCDGYTYCVECAVRKDRVTSPVARFIDDLKEKSWVSDSTESHLHPDEQVNLYSWLLATLRYFADNGDFPSLMNYNQLKI